MEILKGDHLSCRHSTLLFLIPMGILHAPQRATSAFINAYSAGDKCMFDVGRIPQNQARACKDYCYVKYISLTIQVSPL